MTIVMYDSVTLSEVPPNPPAVACYVDGRFANHAEAQRRFPHARVLTIAVNASVAADCLDIETGDANPGQAAAWYKRQKARGVTRPVLYASASVMGAVVRNIQAAGIARSAVRLWSAHYTFHPHICGPASCREMSITADGTQWTDRSHGRNLDESLLAANFFGTAPAQDWTDAMIANLPTLTQGTADKAGEAQMVHRLQALARVIGDINRLPAASAVRATGTYDTATWKGVLVLQKFFGLTEDGIVGQATWQALVAGKHG